MEWYLKVVRDNYANFNGRASRQEYWMFFLFNMIFAIVMIGIDIILGLGFLNVIYSLVVMIPGMAVNIRRLHDIGKSGWMVLIVLIPCIGAFWLLYLMVQDSSPLDNEYGPSPKPKPVSNEAADTEPENNDVEKDDDSSGEVEELEESTVDLETVELVLAPVETKV